MTGHPVLYREGSFPKGMVSSTFTTVVLKSLAERSADINTVMTRVKA